MDIEKVKRILAGSIVGLLLAVTSMAAACDLSCAFGVAESDCHSADARAATNRAMDMTGMDMAGMSMPEMADGQSQSPASEISVAKAGHPSVGDMGPCERQSCDRGSFVATKSGRSNTARVSPIQPIVQNSFAAGFAQILHDARDDLSRREPFQAGPLAIALRI